MDTPETYMATSKKYQKASTVCCSANVLLFLAYQCAFLEEISPLRILREFSRVARRTCRKFLEISSLPSSLTHTCPACLSILFHTGDIKVLGNCTQLTSVNFKYCNKITGGCCFEERSFSRLRPSPHLVPRNFLGNILRIFKSS